MGTPLIQAAYNGRLQVVRLLIERGADVHLSTTGGKTALWCAAYHQCIDSVEVVELLLAARASLDAAFDGVAVRDLPVVQTILQGMHQRTDMLLQAAADGNYSLVCYSLKR